MNSTVNPEINAGMDNIEDLSAFQLLSSPVLKLIHTGVAARCVLGSATPSKNKLGGCGLQLHKRILKRCCFQNCDGGDQVLLGILGDLVQTVPKSAGGGEGHDTSLVR